MGKGVKKSRDAAGYSIFEVLAVLALLAILSGVATNNLKELSDPLENSSAELIAFLKQVRARAISTTSAYKVAPVSNGDIVTSYSERCSDAAVEWVADPGVTLSLPTGAWLEDTDWAICFGPRGLPDGNIQVVLRDMDAGSRTIEVYLGGGVREID